MVIIVGSKMSCGALSIINRLGNPDPQVGYLNKMSDMVRGQLTKIERNKLVSLITMEIHNR